MLGTFFFFSIYLSKTVLSLGMKGLRSGMAFGLPSLGVLGLAAFAGGVFSIVVSKWVSALILIIGSFILPVVSLAFYGSV